MNIKRFGEHLGSGSVFSKAPGCWPVAMLKINPYSRLNQVIALRNGLVEWLVAGDKYLHEINQWLLLKNKGKEPKEIVRVMNIKSFTEYMWEESVIGKNLGPRAQSNCKTMKAGLFKNAWHVMLTPPQLEPPFSILKFNSPPPSSEIFYSSLPSIIQLLNFPTPFVWRLKNVKMQI